MQLPMSLSMRGCVWVANGFSGRERERERETRSTDQHVIQGEAHWPREGYMHVAW